MLNSEIHFLQKSGGGLIHSLTPKRGTPFQNFDHFDNVENQHLYFIFCYFTHKQYLLDSNHYLNIYLIILECSIIYHSQTSWNPRWPPWKSCSIPFISQHIYHLLLLKWYSCLIDICKIYFVKTDKNNEKPDENIDHVKSNMAEIKNVVLISV